MFSLQLGIIRNNASKTRKGYPAPLTARRTDMVEDLILFATHLLILDNNVTYPGRISIHLGINNRPETNLHRQTYGQ